MVPFIPFPENFIIKIVIISIIVIDNQKKKGYTGNIKGNGT